MLQQALLKLMDGHDLSQTDAVAALGQIMDGEESEARIAAFLTALRLKGETPSEIAGMARAMRQRSVQVHADVPGLVDTCGTGGGGVATFNISTAAAFVAAGAGLPIAKHGNRAMTSKCGSSDVLEALGVKLDCAVDELVRGLREMGLAFLFAPLHHPAMKAVGPVRRALPFRTVFNCLGPLTNPAGADRQVIGVYEPAMTELLAEALRLLETRHVWVVHGLDGLDEISTLGLTRVTEVQSGSIRTWEFTPEDLGLERASAADIAPAEDVAGNAEILRSILAGETGARRSPHLRPAQRPNPAPPSPPAPPRLSSNRRRRPLRTTGRI